MLLQIPVQNVVLILSKNKIYLSYTLNIHISDH